MDQSQQQQPTQQQFSNSQLKYKQEQPTIVNTTLPGMQIRVLGVPQTGAKSRVETQIKLCIQLVTDDGDKAQWWSHLKLPEHMVAKDKLKRQVLLSTAPNGSKVANVAGLDANVNPEKMLYLTARVICASDPSRKVVTCLGCIQRERKRSQRRKENKIHKPLHEQDTSHLMNLDDNNEKSLAMEEQKVLLFNCSEVVDFSSGDTILPTRITCYCRHHNERLGFCIYFEIHDHAGKQVATGMSPPIMITDDHKSNKIKSGRKRLRTDVEKPASSSATSSNNNSSSMAAAVTSSFDPRHQPLAYHHQQQQQPQRFNTPQPYNIQPRPPSVPVNSTSPHTPLESPRVATTTSPFMSHAATDKASSSSPALSSSSTVADRPLLQRLIPNEGPTFGGVEVTLLGSGFRAGLTCMFGDVAASSTHYWSPNTLVCILPPAAEAGTVVVSFKEYPLVVDSQDVTLFTYYNENDRALMELALQVVGLKMTGKVEDARDIAMRIVQGGSGGGGSGNGSGSGNQDNQQQQQHSHMSLEHHIIQVLQVMRTFRNVESADVSLTSAQGHTMLHLAAMLGFSKLTETLIDLGCDVNVTDKNGYTALHYSAWYHHAQVVHILLDKGFADPDISNRWNKKPCHLTTNSAIKSALWNHVPLIEQDDDDSDSTQDTSSVMSADVDTSFAEDESDLEDSSSVWLSDIDENEQHPAWPQQQRISSSSWLSDSEDSVSSSSMEDEEQQQENRHVEPVYQGLRYRRNRQIQEQQVQLYQHTTTPTIQYLNQGESTSHSADEILDAQPVHDIDASTDYDDDDDDDVARDLVPKEEMSWMQRTLSHFQPQQQQPTDTNSFLQNIKNNMPAKPAELNLKNIADHLLQFPRPATMVANMSALFGQDQADNKQEEPPAAEQTLAWYMALAYAMGATSLTEEKEHHQQQDKQPGTSSSQQHHVHVVANKRRDKRLFSFWVPMLCLMVIWLIFQFVSSHPGMVDTIIGLTGFRRQYLTIH
ncbi:hypothetical protein FB192DRAFT_1146559 [Mucor lusitanicus]|nr:hypothetical protein FB192DRAFT_1146559 [Mucor lusitanicus]